jgi:hypothetical protein
MTNCGLVQLRLRLTPNWLIAELREFCRMAYEPAMRKLFRVLAN